jgi:5-methylcytosine-specific restriction endonuclease McrA
MSLDERSPVDGLTFRRYLAIQTRNRHRRRFFETVSMEGYSCPSCGRSYPGADSDVWEVHHKDGDPFNGHMVNLVALCHNCHKHTHSTVDVTKQLADWKAGFLDLGSTDSKTEPTELDGQTTRGDFTPTDSNT